MERKTLITKPSAQYALLDSGGEEKLERYGDVTLVRPDPQALWDKHLAASHWEGAKGTYVRKEREGEWRIEAGVPEKWPIQLAGLTFLIRPTSFKHTGVFPEQAPNWEWLTAKLLSRKENQATPPSVLNLFAYTGGATLAAAQAGAEVCHVDASKTAVAWAKENAELSGLSEKPIRWIVEDVITFVEREIKRGRKYDVVIMDPPAFGHGPKDELWKIEEDLQKLLDLCVQLLSDKPLAFIMNGYAAGYSPLAFAYNLEPRMKKFNGAIEYGDLAIEEEGSERLLPCGIFARWSATQ